MIRLNVYRYPNGISLNGKEYLLDETGGVIIFDSVQSVQSFFQVEDLAGQGIYTEAV